MILRCFSLFQLLCGNQKNLNILVLLAKIIKNYFNVLEAEDYLSNNSAIILNLI